MESEVHQLPAPSFGERLKAEPDCQVIDVREWSEFESERIPQSSHAPLSKFDQHAPAISKERPVFLVCRTGNRARKAADRLLELGYSDLYVVEGGIEALKSVGFPVEKGKGRVWALERQVRFTAGVLVLIGLGLGLTVHSAWFVLSGIVGTGLAFSGMTNTCGMAMLLAKMPWNQR